ncbi:hypothetical protein EVJ58_g8796 [Rhodofomes roseus]|uniref:Conserved oligomeric Golgi complex subunit 2 n=1 Tax=Rhodofomes roseus TaxID=34475 RepID=A0A4Y9XZJ5_9APHY|nr:hypothetical protein EVJ58_g8796 [Rhodofomes roseus]
MSSLKSPEVDAASEDPFDLQRLAEELVTREQKSTPHAQDAGEEITKAERDLPVYVPLSHSNPCLSAKDFSVEEFLLSRSYTSLPDLRSELRDYLATLKEELVKLINDDYEAFISLSTDLRGEGARLERLKAPLSDIKSHVLRIDRIKSTLSSDLDHLFASTLTSLTSGSKEGRESKTGELDKAKWIADVTECLRTYDVLGLWRDAEDVLRREIVRDFVKKQNPFEFSTQQAGAQAHILDDLEGPLAGLYNTVLRFVDRDLRRLMEIAERVCVKSGSRAGAAKTNGSAESGDEQGGFEIMANVVWAEIGRAVLDELGGVVFAAGKPDDFRKHHETTQAFIRSLEFLAPSVHAIEVMRTHPVYVQFERRWQLPVYFQLRWKEIVSKLEEALTVTRLERSRNRAVKPFVTTQAAAVWDAISTCWGAPVYIPELNHRFWKFTLQLLSRYKTWLKSSLPVFEATAKVAAAVAAEKLGSTPGSPASLSRAATPNLPTEAASPEAAAADEQSLHQFSTAIIDIRAMKSQVLKIWRGELCIMLPEVDSGESDPSPEDALRQALSGLTSLIPSLSGQIITILSRRACEALLSMRSIPSQFRAMSSSRRTPTEPSYFVSLIFKPVKTFFAVEGPEGAGGPLKDEFMQAYVEEIFEIVAQRYIHFLSAMRKTEESLRRLKKGKKSAFSLFGGSTAKDDDGRADEEKIRAQMMLDVAAFGLDAESLGVAVQHSETFKVLEEMAGASFTDET